MMRLRQILNKKGQGVVEYAILLAVIVGLAVFLNDGSIGNAVQGAFDDMAALLSGEERDNNQSGVALSWYKRGKNQLHNYETGDDLVPDSERIAADQVALANIAGFFLGKTKAEVRAELKDADNGTILLYDYKDLTEEKGNENGNVITGKSDLSNATDRTSGHIYNWMQGDYGQFEGGYREELGYQEGTRYLVSNYMINPESATPDNLHGNPYVNNRSIRVDLKYSGSGNNQVVSDVRVYVTRGERKLNNSYIRELDLNVTKDSNGNLQWNQATQGTGYYKR